MASSYFTVNPRQVRAKRQPNHKQSGVLTMCNMYERTYDRLSLKLKAQNSQSFMMHTQYIAAERHYREMRSLQLK